MSHNSKIYYIKGRQAPYLQHTPPEKIDPLVPSPTKNARHSNQQEADAAAGGGSFTQRVSSFSLLPRVHSTDTFNKQSNAQKQLPIEDANKKKIQASTRNPSAQPNTIQPDWRLRDRMKTVGVGLVLALNIGTDPPDHTKPHPCAVLECWIDPRSVSRSKAKEIIGERLEAQYAKWQLVRTARPLKHRRALDPTVEEVRSLCIQLRRQAREERILLHYNGHGVPRPTANGEIWVFDKNHTEYIPLGIMDLRNWMGKPSFVVLDCSSAGILIPFFKAPLSEPGEAPPTGTGSSPSNNTGTPTGSGAAAPDMDALASQWVNDTIVLCPCSENEWLPMSPDYPADIFTSCLTTPIPIALRWFVRHHPTSMAGLEPEAVDGIPGKANDRKTPLGELNWIFTAVTDSIAWNMLPKPVFQRLFRQDLLVASMFRNFLLADRILRSLGCTPVSYPPLPPGMAEHPLWRAWDLACETLLFQLIQDGVLGNSVPISVVKSPDGDDLTEEEASTTGSVLQLVQPLPPPVATSTYSASSPFFSEQLTAFEVWLEFASIHKMHLSSGTLESPEQLPVVLQVLLSQVHRIRALLLLRRFLDLGPWAVNLALSLGIFPYVMKLLQSPEYKSLLVSIWASVLAFDPTCRVDLLKDGAFHHFVQHLMFGLNNSGTGVVEAAKERTMAAFVLAICCNEYPAGQAECVRLSLHGNCCALLSSYEQGDNARDRTVDFHLPAHFRLWLVLCLANMVKENTATQNEAYRAGVHSRLFVRLKDKDPEVRAAVCCALGCLIGTQPRQSSRSSSVQDLNAIAQQPLQQQHANFGAHSGTLGPNLVIPGAVQARPGVPGQLQPTFPPAGVPNLQWRPQNMEPMQGQHLQTHQQRQPIGVPASQFFNQSVQLRTPQGQPLPLQAPYVMHGQPMQLNPGFGSPSGFLVGGNPVIGQIPLMTPQMHPPLQREIKQTRPSVYEDSRRLELDQSVMAMVLPAMKDGSVVVRYEATIALASAVGKYVEAFLIVAQERTTTNSPSTSHKQEDRMGSFPIPRGLDSKHIGRFREAWEALRSLQHDDPYPAVTQAANKIVSYIHEQLLHFRMESDLRDREREEASSNTTEPVFLAGIEEEPNMPRTPPAARFRNVSQTTGAIRRKPELRRVLSEGVDDHGGSMEQHALLGTASSRGSASNRDVLNYNLPESELYKWKKDMFDTNFEFLGDTSDRDLDPLSPVGAAKAHQESGIAAAREKADKTAARYASLAPKPPKPMRQSIQMLLEQEDEEAQEAAEEEATAKKKELELSENKIIQNEGVTMTAMLRFHPFEEVLVSCGGTGSVALWGTDDGSRLTCFENGNPEGSRMTTSGWMNEESASIFYVGCDDGSVRCWGDLLPTYGVSDDVGTSPSLVSAFHALPMKAGQRGSGLVCEWQQFSGSLLAGGNAPTINCWDLESESLLGKLETDSDANVTTLTTAWDLDFEGQFVYQDGFGPDVLVAGFGDGALKLFDLRTQRSVKDLTNNPPGKATPSRRRPRPTGYKEHKSWVVATAFAGYSNRFEIISGTVAGEIKAWDLRLSSSVRTMEVQRSTMTALTVHSKIPVVATGSHAQFIKLLTLDGDTLQVLRYHEKMASHRIGPVSCLAFHKYKPLLAAGSTDTFIGLYTPKKQIF